MAGRLTTLKLAAALAIILSIIGAVLGWHQGQRISDCGWYPGDWIALTLATCLVASGVGAAIVAACRDATISHADVGHGFEPVRSHRPARLGAMG